MKEKIYTIPVNDAFLSGDECPFCFLEQEEERRALRYVAGPGASYMEPEVRAATDRTGFCRTHMKKLYDFGNTLGSALILQTYYAGILEELQCEATDPDVPAPKKLFQKKQPTVQDRYWQRLREKVDRCYICDKIDYNMERYFDTFFALLKEEEFRRRVESCKGFCLDHFARLLQTAEEKLPNAQREWFYATVYPLMEKNLCRVKEDLDWLVAKFDYRNAGADWKNSQDALQRTMQKLQGGYPADDPFRNE